jgi:hypothetical protein
MMTNKRNHPAGLEPLSMGLADSKPAEQATDIHKQLASLQKENDMLWEALTRAMLSHLGTTLEGRR